MKRRELLRYTLAGGGALVLSVGLNRNQQANAFIMGLLFRAILQAAFSNFQIRDQRWWDRRLEAQLAQREFVRQSFTNVSVAQVYDSPYIMIAASERSDSFANNVAYAFPRIEYNQPTIASISGPGSVGMTVAAEYLQKNRNLNTRQVHAGVIPRLRGGQRLSSMNGWGSSSSEYYPNNYSDTGVRIRYDAVEPRSGGFGLIDVSLDADQRVRVPQIRVNFT